MATALLESCCIAIVYETVINTSDDLSLLVTRSEVAGRLAIQAGMPCLEKTEGVLYLEDLFPSMLNTICAKQDAIKRLVTLSDLVIVAVSRTSTFALNHATLLFILELEKKGYRRALFR